MGGEGNSNGNGRTITLRTAMPIGLLLIILPLAINMAIDYGVQTNTLDDLKRRYEELRQYIEKEHQSLEDDDAVIDIRLRKLEEWQSVHDRVFGQIPTLEHSVKSDRQIQLMFPLQPEEKRTYSCLACHAKKKFVQSQQ